MQAVSFLPKLFQKIWGMVTGCVHAKTWNTQYLFWFAAHATYWHSPSYSPSALLSGGHTRCLDYRALLFWAQQGGLFKQGDYRVLGVDRAGWWFWPCTVTHFSLGRPPGLNYKAFICRTTRLLLDVAPCVSLRLVRAAMLKLRLKHLVNCSGHFSWVITSCPFLLCAQHLLETIWKQTKVELKSGDMRAKNRMTRPIF